MAIGGGDFEIIHDPKSASAASAIGKNTHSKRNHMTTLEIYYSTPDGIKVTSLKTDEDALKVIKGFVSMGINVVRENDQYYIPWHSIVGISHVKKNI